MTACSGGVVGAAAHVRVVQRDGTGPVRFGKVGVKTPAGHERGTVV